MVTWRLFANLAEAADSRRVEIGVAQGETIGTALEELFAVHPALESLVLADDEQLQEHIRLLHEGENPFREADGLETTLQEDDELALFPPVSGG
jgi:molybdopterin synthase sulfur carrier subunit